MLENDQILGPNKTTKVSAAYFDLINYFLCGHNDSGESFVSGQAKVTICPSSLPSVSTSKFQRNEELWVCQIQYCRCFQRITLESVPGTYREHNVHAVLWVPEELFHKEHKFQYRHTDLCIVFPFDGHHDNDSHRVVQSALHELVRKVTDKKCKQWPHAHLGQGPHLFLHVLAHGGANKKFPCRKGVQERHPETEHALLKCAAGHGVGRNYLLGHNPHRHPEDPAAKWNSHRGLHVQTAPKHIQKVKAYGTLRGGPAKGA